MMVSSSIARSATVLGAALLVALGLALAISAVVADQASAQGSVFCDQYPNDPDCDDDGGGPDDDGGGGPDDDGNQGPGGDGDGPVSGDGLGGGNDGGNLPFTGYPLSPLIIMLLILLAVGLTLRGYTAVRDRLGSRTGLG